MRIGVFPELNPNVGGGYQYSQTILRMLQRLPGQKDDKLILFTPVMDDPAVAALKKEGWEVQTFYRPSLAGRILGDSAARKMLRSLAVKLRGRKRKPTTAAPAAPALPNPDVINFQPALHHWLRECQIDLMFYTMTTEFAFEAGIPYVMPVHDVEYRIKPTFAEVSANGEYEGREYCFRNSVRYATLVLVDSEVGKEDLLNCFGSFGLTADRVKVLPFLPAHYLGADVSAADRQRVRQAYKLPERFLFYPAQFWSHKNHLNLVQGLGLLKQKQGLSIPIAFCGSNTNVHRAAMFQEVMNQARALGIAENIRYLGYVPAEDMSALYAEAVALIMPTHFGPTNIPVLEAWSFGCPVLTSDIRGVRDQAKDAAVLVDPTSAESVGDGIYRLWTDAQLRQTLAERGRARLASYTPDDFRRRLEAIMAEARERVAKGDYPHHPFAQSLAR